VGRDLAREHPFPGAAYTATAADSGRGLPWDGSLGSGGMGERDQTWKIPFALDHNYPH